MDEFWNLIYDEYAPEEEALRESLCTLGNGYFATRGAAEEASNDNIHYPGTYLAGGYNRLESDIAGKVIENEDLVNWPNWLLLTFKTENNEWFKIDEVKLQDYELNLDLKAGVLERRIKFEDKQQRQTELISRRIIHMEREHLAAIKWVLTPINWSGKITVHSALDGTVVNNGVERYNDLASRHLFSIDTGQFHEDGIYLSAETTQSGIRMAQCARTEVLVEKENLPVSRKTMNKDKYIAQELTFEVTENKETEIVKKVSVYTSRDSAISDPLMEGINAVGEFSSFEKFRDSQKKVWGDIWHRLDTQMDCEKREQQITLRLHIFHLFQTVSFNSIGKDIGVPSRGWHGEAYRGHIFWDELFILPFLNHNVPEVSRSLLMYRYRRLPQARKYAQDEGYKGAMFPWQSGSNGREESQVIHLNPESGRWLPDNTHLQRHVNAAIAYNIWNYFQVTDDREFLSYYGAEIMLDIARFWADKASWSKEKNRYEIKNVVGPDEYHTQFLDREEQGIDNNAYTNLMVVWVLKRSLQALKILGEHRKKELLKKLDISHQDLELWKTICNKIFVPFVENGKVIAQFEDFEKLEDLDWGYYHEQYGKVLRLDRILEKEGDDVNKYKAVKQADVLMLFYLFSAEELEELFTVAGYNFNPEWITNSINYYLKITSHGSTLSMMVYSWVFARSQRDKSWENFKNALISDLKDIQGGTTSEGIHLGAMAGTVDLLQRCYTGLEVRDDALWLNPYLPTELKRIDFRLKYRGHSVSVHLTQREMTLKSDGGWSDKQIMIMVKNKKFTLENDERKTFKYGKKKVELV